MSDPGTQAPRGAGGRGWLKWLLVVSLAINLAIAGLVAGIVLKGHGIKLPGGFDLSIGPLARALSEEDRRWIMREMTERQDMRPRDADERRAEAAAIVAAVGADPFDPDAVSEVLDGLRLRGEALQRGAMAALLARIESMTSEERAAFARRLAAEFDRLRDPPPPPGG